MAKQTIGEFLATQRKAKGYTQQEVADRLGISNRTLSSWEQGRAYPDILTLPALAEIYGVTADEILNGERALNPLDDNELSEKNRSKLKKRILTKHSTSLTVLTGAVAGGGLLLMLISVIGLAVPGWLIITISVLAIIDIIVVFILLIAFGRSALNSLGIFSDEPLPEDGAQILHTLHMREAKCINLMGLVWTFGGAISAALWFFISVSINNENEVSVLGFFLTILFGIVMLAVAAVLKRKTVVRYGTDNEKRTLSKRRKLLLKTSLFTLIPIALCAVALIITANVRYDFTDKGYGADHDTFYKVMHTVRVPDHLEVDEAKGSHYIDFENLLSTPSEDGKYNFEGIKIIIEYDDEGEAKSCTLQVVGSEGNIIWTRFGERIPVKDSDELIFNFPHIKRTMYGAYGEEDINEAKHIEVKDGFYQIIYEFSSTYFSDALPIAVGGMVISVAVAAVIYLILRKKV